MADEIYKIDARKAVTNSIAKLTEAISAAENTFITIVLSCQEHNLITPNFSKELRDNFTGKSTQLRATDLINNIETVVGSRPDCLDAFLSILVNKGGIPGTEAARAVAETYSYDLPICRDALASDDSALERKRSNEDENSITFHTCQQLPKASSLVDLLKPCNISMECLQMKFTDDLLVLLALEGQTVENVASYFRMEDYIDKIEEYKSENGKIVSILSMWKETKGRNATYFTVIDVLFLSGQQEIAKSIAVNLQKKYNVPSSPPINAVVPFRPEHSFGNWNEFDASQKERIKNRLRVENKDIIVCFNRTFLDIMKSFKERNVDFDLLRMCLKLELKALKNPEVISELKKAHNVSDVFDFIDEIGCDWINYHLLDILACQYGCDKDRQLMNSYVRKLWSYLQRSLYRIPPESFGPVQSPSTSISTYHFVLPVADGIDISGQQLKKIELLLANKLEIAPFLIQIEIRIGSIIIHFIIDKQLLTDKKDKLALLNKDAYDDDTYYMNVNLLFSGHTGILPKEINLCGYIDDPASCILQKHSDVLSRISLPFKVIQLLCMEGVIDKETFDKLVNSSGRLMKNESFRALLNAVYLDHNKLKVFANVLLRYKDTASIANDILQDLLVGQDGDKTPPLQKSSPGLLPSLPLPSVIENIPLSHNKKESSSQHNERPNYLETKTRIRRVRLLSRTPDDVEDQQSMISIYSSQRTTSDNTSGRSSIQTSGHSSGYSSSGHSSGYSSSLVSGYCSQSLSSSPSQLSNTNYKSHRAYDPPRYGYPNYQIHNSPDNSLVLSSSSDNESSSSQTTTPVAYNFPISPTDTLPMSTNQDSPQYHYSNNTQPRYGYPFYHSHPLAPNNVTPLSVDGEMPLYSSSMPFEPEYLPTHNEPSYSLYSISPKSTFSFVSTLPQVKETKDFPTPSIHHSGQPVLAPITRKEKMMLAVMLYLQHPKCHDQPSCHTCQLVKQQIDKMTNKYGNDTMRDIPESEFYTCLHQEKQHSFELPTPASNSLTLPKISKQLSRSFSDIGHTSTHTSITVDEGIVLDDEDGVIDKIQTAKASSSCMSLLSISEVQPLVMFEGSKATKTLSPRLSNESFVSILRSVSSSSSASSGYVSDFLSSSHSSIEEFYTAMSQSRNQSSLHKSTSAHPHQLTESAVAQMTNLPENAVNPSANLPHHSSSKLVKESDEGSPRFGMASTPYSKFFEAKRREQDTFAFGNNPQKQRMQKVWIKLPNDGSTATAL